MKSELQNSREKAFLEDCEDLCDLSLVDALDLLKDKPTVRNFLSMQRAKGRQGSMRGILERIRQSTSATVSDSNPADTSVQSSIETSNTSIQPSESSDVEGSLVSGTSSISIADNSRNDPDYVPEVKEKPPPKKPKEELVDERVAGVLDKLMLY